MHFKEVLFGGDFFGVFFLKEKTGKQKTSGQGRVKHGENIHVL